MRKNRIPLSPKSNYKDNHGLLAEAKSEGLVRYVVGAVIAEEDTVLLLRRKMDDFMGGIYELPSGQVDGGESLESALRREVFEETGLEIAEIHRHLSNFDYESKSDTRTRQFNFEVRCAAQAQFNSRNMTRMFGQVCAISNPTKSRLASVRYWMRSGAKRNSFLSRYTKRAGYLGTGRSL